MNQKKHQPVMCAGTCLDFMMSDLFAFMDAVCHIVKADFMKFDYSYPSDCVCHIEMQECFAYDGIKKIGVIDKYLCGIFERLNCWFDGLGIEYSVTPQVDGCMIHTDSKCFMDFKLKFL